MSIERDISEYNGSQLKMFRIDEIIKGISMCRHTLDLQNWLYYLKDFDMELESVKKKDEREQLDKELKQISEEVNKHIQVRTRSRFRTKKTPTELIDQLETFQKKLLRIFKESGLEMKLQGDAMSNFGK